jgi:hypothetical protein
VFVAWTCLYFAVLHTPPPASATSDPAFVQILLIISVVLVIGSIFVRKYLRRRAESTGREVLWRMSFMLPLVFCEAAAVSGVAVWGATGSSEAYWFLVLGLAGLLYQIPRRTE